MIYTCTVNPSLDYYLKVTPPLSGSGINRTENEDFNAGGKGVNVSIVLNNLMIPNVALGFLGGFTKDYYLSFIKKYTYIEPLFTTINENTRINLKILSDHSIDINAKGPHVSDEEFERFRKRLFRIYPGDIFVLSGNVQNDLFTRMSEVIHELALSDIKIVLDTNEELLKNCFDAKPFLVRLTKNDLQSITAMEDTVVAIRKLVDLGIQNVLVHGDDREVFLGSASGIYVLHHEEKEGLNTTGMDDSMVAGFLYAIQKGALPLEAFRYANAAGMATALGDGLADRRVTEECFASMNKEERIDEE